MAPEDVLPRTGGLGRQALVALPEHIDVSNERGQIREELLSVINRGAEALIADMTATLSCDHAGVDAVARAYQRAAGQPHGATAGRHQRGRPAACWT